MASAQLPGPILTAAERDDIIVKFGGDDAYLSAFSAWLTSELERRAASQAREAVNVVIREAVEAAAGDLPASLMQSDAETPEAVE